MKFTKVLLLALAVCLLFFTASAGAAEDLKIGVLYIQKAVITSEAGKAAKVRLEEKMKEIQAAFKTEEDELKELEAEVKKKSSVWSEEKKTEKVREYQKKGREYQAKTEDARFELKKLENKEFEPILKAMEKVVMKLGKDKGYTTIVDSTPGKGVLYFIESIDITDEVVKAINAELPVK